MWNTKHSPEDVVATRKLDAQQRHASEVGLVLTRNPTLNPAQASRLVKGFMRKELVVGHDKAGNEVTLTFGDIVKHAAPLGVSAANDDFFINYAEAIKEKGLDTSNTVFVDFSEVELRCCAALAAKATEIEECK